MTLLQNIYEVNVRQYTTAGNFQAFKPFIKQLQKIGVQTLWFMPLHPIGVIRRKGSLGSYYSIKNYQQINSDYGDDADFKEIVKEAHQCGMHVIIDWVANHTAWDHEWTLTHPEYYVHDDVGHFVSPFDWTDVIQLNHKNIAQQQAMIESMRYWIENLDIDGFRCDMAHLCPIEFWENTMSSLNDSKNNLLWFAETESEPYTSLFPNYYAWNYMHTSTAYCKGEISFSDFVNVLKQYASLKEKPVFFTSNHDENSFNGTEFEKYGVYTEIITVLTQLGFQTGLLYSGQEIPNYKRLLFFDKDALLWQSQKATTFEFYAKLFHIKNNYFIYQNSSQTETKVTVENGLLVIKKQLKNECILLLLHLDQNASKILNYQLPESYKNYTVLISNTENLNASACDNINLSFLQYAVLYVFVNE